MKTLWVTIRFLQGTNQPKVQMQRVKIATEMIILIKHAQQYTRP